MPWSTSWGVSGRIFASTPTSSSSVSESSTGLFSADTGLGRKRFRAAMRCLAVWVVWSLLPGVLGLGAFTLRSSTACTAARCEGVLKRLFRPSFSSFTGSILRSAF